MIWKMRLMYRSVEDGRNIVSDTVLSGNQTGKKCCLSKGERKRNIHDMYEYVCNMYKVCKNQSPKAIK